MEDCLRTPEERMLPAGGTKKNTLSTEHTTEGRRKRMSLGNRPSAMKCPLRNLECLANILLLDIYCNLQVSQDNFLLRTLQTTVIHDLSLLVFEDTFTSFFKDKAEIRVFFAIFA